MSWAIITGASTGIGREYAKIFAKRGINCILVARSENLLNELAKELEEVFKIKSKVFALDLSLKENSQILYQSCQDLGYEIDFLINNAGAGIFDFFHQSDLNVQQTMLTLNVESPTILTHLFLKDMIRRNKGYIQIVASIASYLPTPLYATYGASKAYLRHFGVSLNYELKDTKIHVSVINPGFTDTDFFKASKQKVSWIQKAQMMSAKRCAYLGFKSLMRNKNSSMAGFVNWFTAHILLNNLPSRFLAKFIYDDLIKNNPNLKQKQIK